MSQSTLSLAQLQKHFIAEFTRNSNPKFRETIKGNVLNNNVDQLIAIYCNNHYGARLSALLSIFPVTEQIIGSENFTPLALKFSKQCTSTHWDLNTNGDEFIDFIHNEISKNSYLNELFYLAELSRLEYLFHLTYYAENIKVSAVLNQQTEQDAAKMCFIKNPSLHLFKTPYPVYQIWQNNKNGQGELSVKDTQEKYFHVIYREEFKPCIKIVDESEFELLSLVIKGVTLLDLVNQHGEYVTKLLPEFLKNKWITPLI